MAPIRTGRQAPPAGPHAILRLGSHELTITALGWRRATLWRQLVLDGLRSLSTLALNWESVRLDTQDGISDVIGRAEQLIIVAPDTIFELLLAHDLQFAAVRADLEEEATTREVAVAFKEVLLLEFPLEEVRGLWRMALSGPAAPTTSKSLPTPSGASSETALRT